MSLRSLLVSLLFVLLIFSARNMQAQDRGLVKKVQPFLKEHCIRCHGADREEGGVRVDQLKWDVDDLGSVDDIQNILDEIVVDSMPPEGEPRPAANDLKEISELLSKHIANAKKKYRSGGGRPVRRLTKTEYVNTVYDLLGVHVEAKELSDDLVVGSFDTEASELYTTDMHLDICLSVGRNAVRRFIASRNSEPGRTQLKSVSSPRGKKGSFSIAASDVPSAGFQVARVVCWQKDPTPSNSVFFGPARRPIFEITGTPDSPQHIDRTFFESTTETWASNPKVMVGEVQNFQVVNPQPYEFFAKFKKRYGDRIPDKAANELLTDFVELVNRGREVDKKLVRELVGIFEIGRKQGEPFWQAIVEPMALSMCTMEAMFHFETRNGPKKSQYVSPVEMVNRVSYFLWRSAPDAELLRLAKNKKWYESSVRRKQFERMMKDEKFDRFLKDFTTQWLELDRQDLIAVDDRLFGKFNHNAKGSIKEETIQFVSHVVRENLPLNNLIESDFMMINNLTAEHYGLPRVKGNEFRVAPVPKDSKRGGILTQAGILMQTGTGERTSIVERGVFVLRKLLNDPPLPPPPLVNELPSEGRSFASMTGAELVRKHRSAPQCASCHNKIDSLGVGLEEFDAVGLARTVDTRIDPNRGKVKKKQRKNKKPSMLQVPLETNGRLGGRKFVGVEGLKKLLLTKDKQLAETYISALLTLANGRKSGVADDTIVDDIVKRAGKVDFPARSILIAILQSDAFTTH